MNTGGILHSFSAPVSTSDGPTALAFSGVELFLTDAFSTTSIYVIDPVSGGVLRTFAAPSSNIDGLGYVDGKLYAMDYSLSKIYELNPTTGALLRTISPPVIIGGGLDGGNGRLFASNFGTAIYELSLVDGSVIRSLIPTTNVYGLGFTGFHLYSTTPGVGTDQYDPNSGSYLGRISTLGFAALAGGGAVWLSEVPGAGTVLPNDSMHIQIKVKTDQLDGGSFHATLNIKSNDPVTPQLFVPIQLRVFGAPNLILSKDTINFGDVFINYPETLQLAVSNNGTDTLRVTGITSSNPKFTIAASMVFAVPPRLSHSVPVSFLQTVVGAESGTLSIASNDPSDPTVTVHLRGNGIYPPVIGVSPDSLGFTLNEGDSATATLTLSNTGLGALNFTINNVAVFGASLSQLVFSPIAKSSIFREDDMLNVKNTMMSASTVYSILNQNSLAATPSATAQVAPNLPAMGAQNSGKMTLGEMLRLRQRFTAAGVALRVAVLDSYGTDYAGPTWDSLNANWGRYGSTEIVIDYSSLNKEGITYTDIVNTAADVLVISDAAYGNWDFTSAEWSAINQYVQEGHGLVVTSGSINNLNAPNNTRNLTVLFGLDSLSQYQWASPASNLNFVVPDHPLLKNISPPYQPGYPYTAVPVPSHNWKRVAQGADVIAISGDSTTSLLTNQNRAYVSNIPEYSSNQSDYQLLYNAFVWTGNSVSWLSENPTSGTVAPGQSISLQAKVKTDQLDGGTFHAHIAISSNDPAKPKVDVPVQLRVIGRPNLVLSRDTLNFGNVFMGYPDTLLLVVSNNGSDTLHVTGMSSANPKFSVLGPTAFDVPQRASRNVPVSFLPTVVGAESGTLSIMSNDPSDPTIVVHLFGNGIYPPVIGVTPDSLAFTLNEGDSATSRITIENTGLGMLNYHLTTTDDPVGSSPHRYVIRLTLSDRFGTTRRISFGIDPLATYDIDNFLGEYELPPPPPETFYPRFIDIPGRIPVMGIGLGLDLRGYIMPAQVDTYKVFFDSPFFLPVTISWPSGLSAYLSGCHMIDGVDGHIVDVNMLDSTIVRITDSRVYDLLIITRGTGGWLTETQESGAVAPGDSQHVSVKANADQLSLGLYRLKLNVHCNDPAHLIVTVPVRLTVASTPHIVLSNDTLDFGDAIIGYPNPLTLRIFNTGLETLQVRNFSFDNVHFGIDGPPSINVDGHSFRDVTVVFTPPALGVETGSMTIRSNDPRDSVVHVHLSGNGVYPPHLVVLPESLAVSYYYGDSASLSFQMSNDGLSTLHYQLTEGKSEDATFGSALTPSTTRALMHGNIYRVSSFSTLDNFSTYAEIPAPTLLQFAVYESSTPAGTYHRLNSVIYSVDTGRGFYSSGSLNTALTPGKYYYLGTATRYYGSFYTSPQTLPLRCSFGEVDLAGLSVYDETHIETTPIVTTTTLWFQAVTIRPNVIRSITPNAGDIVVGANRKIIVNVAGHLPVGEYHTRVKLTTNDPGQPDAGVPTHVIVELPLDLAGDWNLLSIPLHVTDNRRKTLFPVTSSVAFMYSGRYVEVESLAFGMGFWLKFSSSHVMGLLINGASDNAVNIHARWNLIGAPPYTVNAARAQSVPPGNILSRFIGYTSARGYYNTDTLRPGAGYWVKANDSGLLIFDARIMSGPAQLPSAKALALAPDAVVSDRPAAFNELLFTDARGGSRTIYFSSSSPDQQTAYGDLPPRLPGGVFDVRFASQRLVETGGSGSGLREIPILVTDPEYPLTIRWTIHDAQVGHRLRMKTNEGKLNELHLKNCGSFVLAAGDLQSVQLTIGGGLEEQLPKSFAMYQNYPNPFNPTTQLRFDLPVSSRVRLSLFNILGQEVMRLLDDEDYPAGAHTIAWDGSDKQGNALSSGVYFYTISAVPYDHRQEPYSQSRKLIILK